MADRAGEILFQSFVQEAIASSSGSGRDVHAITLSTRHFLCRPRLCPLLKVPYRMALERLIMARNQSEAILTDKSFVSKERPFWP